MPGFAIFAGDGPSNTPEVHRNHRWSIVVDFPIGSGGSPAAERLGTLYAQNVMIPELSFEEEKILGGSIEYKIAKKASWGDVTVKFYDVYGLYQSYREWQQLIWTPETGIGKASDYKGRVHINMLDGSGTVKQQYTLRGAYPKRISHGELSYTNSDLKILTIVFSYDFADIELSDSGRITDFTTRVRTS